MKTGLTALLAALAALFALGLSRGASADTFVLPHVLERDGRVTTTAYTFDTQFFASYSEGAGGGGGGASIDFYLFDAAGTVAIGGGGGVVCNPCVLQLDAAHPEGLLVLEDAFDAAGDLTTERMTGFALIDVSGAEAKHVNLQGFVVNSHTGPFDLSVFGFEPQPIRSSAGAIVPPGGPKIVRIDGIEETLGLTQLVGGATDTLFKAIYTTGLIDGEAPLGATVELQLFGGDGLPLQTATGRFDPIVLDLDRDGRVASLTVEEMLQAAGGFHEPAAGSYLVATIHGDWQNVVLAAYVIESNSGPNDLLRFSQLQAAVVPEPATVSLLAIGFCLLGVRRALPRRQAAKAG